MGIEKPKELERFNNWFPESGNIECNCGEIIHLSSSIEQQGEKLCKKCNLMYQYWNNKDGSGLRFNIKGYFPFYPDGYKFIIEKN